MAKQFHLADLFETVAQNVPDLIAIQSDAGDLSFAELDNRTDQLAAGLFDRGIERGDTVGLYLMNCPEYIEAFIATIKIGAVPFNVNYRYTSDELRYLFSNANSAAIICNAEFTQIVDGLRADLLKLKLTVAVGDGPDTKQTGSIPFSELLESAPRKGFERSENDIMLQYTGGTTGMPKGVMWPHKAFFFACLNGGGHFHPAGPISNPEEIATRASEGYRLKMFTIAPLMHGAAIWTAWSGLLAGLTLVLDPMRRFDPAAIWDRVEKFGVNVVQIVGDAMAGPLRDVLVENPDRWDLSTVVNFGSGGAVFSQHLKDGIKSLIPSAVITDGMGTSEGGISGMAVPSDDGIMRLVADEHQKIAIEGRFAEPGETGFIAQTGHIPVGYYGDAEKTVEVFQNIEGQLWVLAGDQGRLDDDGMITMFGRGSTCINSGGEKVFPEEVEEAMRAHPAIMDAVVAGQADERWGERVVGVASTRDGKEVPSLDDMRDFLTARLAGYKIPKALVWVDAVKRSPAGKQDYRWAKEVAETAERESA